MSINKQLRQPDNWQDFETLCKKLWAEIWDCPETKKNGRSGQNQSGVDVWGMDPQKRIIGIQCKGKDTYTHKQFSKKEICQEIEKAKLFKPALAKFYFATTAIKDVEIEEFVRELNQRHLEIGLFEVHLFCWEDMIDLIDENKRTHDWYVNEQKYKTAYQVNFTFGNDQQELMASPKFNNVITTFVKATKPHDPIYKTLGGSLVLSTGLSTFSNDLEKGFNKSFFPITFKITNKGSHTLRDVKINISFDGQVQEITFNNERGTLAFLKDFHPDLLIVNKGKTVCFIPNRGVLVGSEFATSSTIYLKTAAIKNKVKINWELLADGFKQSGELWILVIPQLIEQHRSVSNSTREGTENIIQDFIEKNK